MVKLARGLFSFLKDPCTSERNRERIYKSSKINALRIGRGDVSLFWHQGEFFCNLYLPLQGHLGCFQAFPPRKDVRVDNEQEDNLCADARRCSKINYTQRADAEKRVEYGAGHAHTFCQGPGERASDLVFGKGTSI